MIVIAMEAERKLVPPDTNEEILITGIGAANVILALKNIDRKTPIHNIGYAGADGLPIGTRVRVGDCMLYHPNAGSYLEPNYSLDGDVPCFTAGDFVTENRTGVTPCLFDMELAYIIAMGFENVTAEKIVSDNLSTDEYNKTKGE